VLGFTAGGACCWPLTVIFPTLRMSGTVLSLPPLPLRHASFHLTLSIYGGIFKLAASFTNDVQKTKRHIRVSLLHIPEWSHLKNRFIFKNKSSGLRSSGTLRCVESYLYSRYQPNLYIKYQPKPRNIPEHPRPQIHRGRILKSRNGNFVYLGSGSVLQTHAKIFSYYLQHLQSDLNVEVLQSVQQNRYDKQAKHINQSHISLQWGWSKYRQPDECTSLINEWHKV
jgi:hypothetical protein